MKTALSILINLPLVALGLIQIWVMGVILWSEWGLLGLVAGYALFPIAILALPVYAGIALGDWTLLWFYPAAVAYWASRGLTRVLLPK